VAGRDRAQTASPAGCQWAKPRGAGGLSGVQTTTRRRTPVGYATCRRRAERRAPQGGGEHGRERTL